MTTLPVETPPETRAAGAIAAASDPPDFGRDAILAAWTAEKIHAVAYGVEEPGNAASDLKQWIKENYPDDYARGANVARTVCNVYSVTGGTGPVGNAARAIKIYL